MFRFNLKIVAIGGAILISTSLGLSALSVSANTFSEKTFSSDLSVLASRSEVVQALAPKAWSITFNRGVDSKKQSHFSVKAGEQWVFALDRWLISEGISASVDWADQSITLVPLTHFINEQVQKNNPFITHLDSVAEIEVKKSDAFVRSNFYSVAEAILPKGWKYSNAIGMDPDVITSATINGGDPWTASLERWLSDNGYTATIEWGTKTVTVRPLDNAAPQFTGTRDASATTMAAAEAAFPTLPERVSVLLASADASTTQKILSSQAPMHAVAQPPAAPADGVSLKLSQEISDSIGFADGSVRLGPVGRAKALHIWKQMDPIKQQMYLYGYSGRLKDKARMSDLAMSRAISTKIYMVNEFSAKPEDITVVDPRYYLHNEPLPAEPKQVKAVIRQKGSSS